MRCTWLVLAAALVACRNGKDDAPSDREDTGADTDSAPVDSGEAASDDSGASDSGGSDSDNTDSADTDSGAADGATSVVGAAWCASAGSMSGGGYSAVTCLSPVDLAAGTVSTGGGYVWQAGPAVWMAP